MPDDGLTPELYKSALETAGTQARELLAHTLQGLTSGVGGAGAGTDKFFPNGIELIYVKVEAGLTEKTKVIVELKVAGEKGLREDISPLEVEADS